jgi:hypothetical protein
LTTTGGEKLIGKVQSAAGNTLRFQSNAAGTVSVALDAIRSLVTDEPVMLLLKDGTSRRCRLLAAPEERRFRIEPDGLSLALDAIEAINPPVTPVNRPANPWRGSASFGLNLIQNEINSRNLSVKTNVQRTTDRDRANFDAAYLNARENQTTTEESAFLNGAYNFGTNRSVYGVVEGSLRTDSIQRLSLRTLLSVGAGHQWVSASSLGFRTNLGVSLREEKFVGEADQVRGTAQFTRLRHEFNFYPNFDNPADNYLMGQFNLQQLLPGRFTFDIFYLIDYTSRPGPSSSRSTSKLILGLGRQF